MSASESVEHKKIKDLISAKLKDWAGASIEEYPSSGHELDVFAVTRDGISIYVEIIWSDSLQNFFRDMSMIQTADADIKLVVVSPKILRNEKCQREFEKVAISQRKLGFAMHGDLIDGTIIIENSGYLEKKFREIVIDLINHVQKYGKVIGKQIEFQPKEPRSVDKLKEQLLSNLFPVIKFPSSIFSSPTDVRKVAEVFKRLGPAIADHPFLPKNKRLYTFDNLRNPSSLFSPIISKNDITEEQTSEWLRDSDERNDLMYLFHLSLEKYCKKRGLYFDKKHDRFVCQLKDEKDDTFTWRAGSKIVSRKVAKRVFGKSGNHLYCTHYAADLKFMFIDDKLFLKIEPTITFTSDGYHPIRIEKLASLMSRYLSKQYNNTYLSLVRFWAKYLSKLDVTISIPAGEPVIEVSVNPIATPVSVGIVNETVPAAKFQSETIGKEPRK